MSEETWRQVVDTDPAAMKPSDIANLGPPPRDLMPAHEQYISRAKQNTFGMWVFFAVLFTGGFAIAVAILGPTLSALTQAWLPLIMIGLAVWTGNKRAAGRAKLRRVLREGALRMAYLEDNISVAVGRGMAKRNRFYARFAIDGKKVLLVSMNDSLGWLQPGQWVEVVWLAEVPDEIVPAFLLT